MTGQVAVAAPAPKTTFTPAGLAELYRLTLDGGLTYDFNAGLIARFVDGYAVSISGGVEVLAGDYLAFVNAYAKVLTFCAANGITYIGTWLNEGIIYIDPVVISDDYLAALATAKAHNQIAFYGFAEGAAISTKEV